MKLAWIAVSAMTVPVAAFAQYTPGSAPRTYTQGNVLHPGGVPPQSPAGAPILAMGGYGQRSSSGGRGQGHRSNAPHPPHDRSVIVPFYFVGGYGAGYSEPLPEQQPNQQQEPPVLVINQDYKREMLNPVVHDYSNVPLLESPSLDQRQSTPPPARIQQEAPPPDPSPTIYLIAMNDGSIVAALGFWMEGDTLNYITREGNRNRVTIDRVDRPFSVKLNADRNLEFKLQ
jgi:hypothetical protein